MIMIIPDVNPVCPYFLFKLSCSKLSLELKQLIQERIKTMFVLYLIKMLYFKLLWGYLSVYLFLEVGNSLFPSGQFNYDL